MNYCSLDDAFQALGGAPTPGCEGSSAAKQARKEERRKAKRCKGPPLAFFDPDQSTQGTVEALTDASATSHWSDAHTNEASQEEFHHKKHQPDQDRPNFDKDPLYEYVQREVNDHVMHVTGSTTEAYRPSRKSFFGADPDEEVTLASEPQVSAFESRGGSTQSTFETAFEPTRLSAPSMAVQPATSTMPFPNMYWKSKTPAQSAFIEHLPPMPISSNRIRHDSRDEMDAMKRKIDRLFSQLEDMKGGSASPEQMTSEIMMFVSSGIVILFLMDLMVKKTSA